MTSRYFVAFCLCDEKTLQPARFGFTVPRVVGKAVQRNRIKRRMREAVRSQLGAAPTSWAIVFNPRRSVLTATLEDLSLETRRLLSRCSES